MASSIAQVKELYHSKDWKEASTYNGLKTFTMTLPNGKTVTRGDIVLQDVTLPQLVSILSTPTVRPVFDSRMVSTEWVDRNKDGSGLAYAHAKGQWPVVADRDLVIAIEGWIIDEELGWVIIQKSTSDSRYPENKGGKVRATLEIAAVCIKETPQGLKCTHFQNQDINGSIPDAVKKMLLGEQLSFLNLPIDFIRKKYCPPCLYFNRTNPEYEWLGTTNFNIKTYEMGNKMRIPRPFEMSFVIDSRLYPKGAEIKCNNLKIRKTNTKDHYIFSFDASDLTDFSIRPGTSRAIRLNGQAI